MIEPPAAEPTRASWLGLIGVGLGLGLIAAAYAVPFLFRQRELDAETQLTQSFAYESIPFDMQPKRAVKLPMGEVLVVLAKEGATPLPAEELIAQTAADDAPPPKASDGPTPFFDWSKLPEGPKDQPPVQLAFVWYPRSMAEQIMRQQFWNLGDFGSFIGSEGGKAVLDSGEIAWGSFSAPFVRERRYVYEKKEDPERRYYRESLRVNLSRKSQPCVLYAYWDEGQPASKSRLEEALRSFLPHE